MNDNLRITEIFLKQWLSIDLLKRKIKKAFTVDGSSSDGVEYTLRLHDWAKLFSWSITWAWVKSFFKIERNKLYFKTQIILKQNFNYFTFNMFYK